MTKEKFTNADKIEEILEKYQKMSSEERLGLLNDLMEHNSFSSQFHGGINLEPINYFYVIKLKYLDDNGASWEKFESKQDAIDCLNAHHEEINNLPKEVRPNPPFPNYHQLEEKVQGFLIFEAPGDFRIITASKETLPTNLTHSEQLEFVKASNFLKKSVIENLKPKKHQLSQKRYPNSVSAILDHERYIQEKIQEIACNVQSSIVSWTPIEMINEPKIPQKWIDYHSEPKASTVDAIYNVLKQEKVVTIAGVLFKSHTILEPNYNKESDGRRKPINSNEVHGVYTTSNPKKVLARMTRLGFDNQPIYCDVAKRCVAMITLKESIKFLTVGALDHEDFTDYQNMKKNRLLREPPPMFTPFDSVELAVSLFNAGCESVLFNFDSEEWLVNGGDPKVCEILENGIHIFTPHDVVAYFTE